MQMCVMKNCWRKCLDEVLDEVVALGPGGLERKKDPESPDEKGKSVLLYLASPGLSHLREGCVCYFEFPNSKFALKYGD